MTLERRIVKVGSKKTAWDRGVVLYALELARNLEGKDMDGKESLQAILLNGAKDWKEYSYGGCALAMDEAIAKRLCTNGQFVRVRHGRKAPNKEETWMDVQARALVQAASLVEKVVQQGTDA